MKLTTALLGGAALLALAWWYSSRVPGSGDVPAGATGAGCPLPPRVTPGDAPLQSEVPAALRPFALDAAALRPLAGFSVEARVLGRQDYSSGRESALSPTDLALGWNRMREDGVLSKLAISQSSRWYNYRWKDQPPLPLPEIVRSSANMHMIPANASVAQTLAAVGKDDNVRIDGWLVQAESQDGWKWRSSTSREDSGGGACEVVYVCALTRL